MIGSLCILMVESLLLIHKVVVFYFYSLANMIMVVLSTHGAGFNSLYLYKRFYRCNASLDGFSFDDGNVERRRDISLDEFTKEYDAKKPVCLQSFYLLI